MHRSVILSVFATLVAVPLFAGDHSRSVSSYTEMFVRKYDTNKDGKLNADEYPERYRKYFGKTDENQDGYVDAAEITTQLQAMQSQWREQMEQRANENRQRKLKQLVDRAFEGDANEDGRLNADEAADVIDRSFGEVDADNDGYLDRAEVEQTFGLKSETAEKKSSKNIVETAAGAGSFQTLLKAAVAAGLADALQGDGPFTVFAPTDEAFAEIPAETLKALLKDKRQLANVLKYHVVAGEVQAKDVVKLSQAETLSGDSVRITTGRSGVRIDDAKVLKTDILCSNGVIHVIDAVLIPGNNKEASSESEKGTDKSIVETAISAGSFKTLVTALQAAGLVDALNGKDNLTVFAPTDEAFAKIPKKVLQEILADKEKLQAILTYHVVPGKVLAKDVVNLKSAKTLQGQSVDISVTSAGVKIDGANVVKTDITCSNGVIHVIDAVIVPDLSESESASGELFSFNAADFKKQWVTVNDGVMGGVSEGRVRLTDDNTLEFYGNLSLRNNGGFASAQSMPQELNLSEGDVLVARVRGDGREYYLNLYEPTRRIAFSYRAAIQTADGEWTEFRVPLDDFYATSFGRRIRDAQLNPSKVNSIGFLLSDKKEGPFRLEVESIRVVKAGQ